MSAVNCVTSRVLAPPDMPLGKPRNMLGTYWISYTCEGRNPRQGHHMEVCKQSKHPCMWQAAGQIPKTTRSEKIQHNDVCRLCRPVPGRNIYCATAGKGADVSQKRNVFRSVRGCVTCLLPAVGESAAAGTLRTQKRHMNVTHL